MGDYSHWFTRRTLLAVLAELSERLTFRAFTRHDSHEAVANLFARAAQDPEDWDIRRFAIRALGNLQLFTAPVAEAFFGACQDVDDVYKETHTAAAKFKTFAPDSLERLVAAVRSPSLTVAYHAALLLDEPAAERMVYDFRENEDGNPVGALYDVIYEALTRVVAGPDVPSQGITESESMSVS